MKGLLRSLITAAVFFCTPALLYAQPANNLCSGAVLLTSATSCVNTGGTLTSSTYTPPMPGCGATNKNDVWYYFVAQAANHTITVSSGPSQMRLQLFSGTCASLTSVACGNSSIAATGLTVGNTYYVRVYNQSNNSGTFNICITHAAPANDNCAGAVSLTSYTSCINTASTLNLATATGGLPAGCQPGGTHYDVWFSFVAATTSETITISGLGANINNPRIQLYSGSCAVLTSVACGTTTLTQGGLTIGNTYFVRVANLNADPSGTGTVANFNICVTHTGPANDDCAGAISLTSGAVCVNTGGTLVGATYSTISPLGCGVANRNDVWYSFVAVSSNPTITLSSAPANPRIQLFSGSCGSLTSLSCGNTSLTASGLTVGNTYYIRVYTDPNVLSGTFNICITHVTPANDNCAGAISLTSYTTCTNTASTLNLATVTAGLPVGCQPVGAHYDVWFSFVALATSETVTISGLGANITNPRVQLYSGGCGLLTSLTCGTTTLTNAALTTGNTYYVRVANLNADPSGAGTVANFNICITHPGLVNDFCTNAVSLTSASTCINTGGTLVGATYTAIGAIGCGVASRNDVWYSFVAQSTKPTITLSSAPANPRIQLFSGSCAALTSVACGNGSLVTSGLTVGNTYYVRVYTDPNAAGTFNICITDPAMAAVIDYSKSYINITKGTTGGSVEPGDQLEIRATFVVRTNSVDSLAFYDTLSNNNGFTYVSGTLATQTNEGKIYRAFTDAADSDEGTLSAIPITLDTAVQINIGLGASGTARGKLRNTSRPSFYNSTCIIMATYRVQVYGGYDTKINWGGGGFTYRDTATGKMGRVSFKNDSLVVYISPGLCSNALSAVNKVGVETDGTFSKPTSPPAPLARNRGTSTAVPGYTYDIFKVGGGPQDYYYGVANNTSATFSIINTLAKSGAVPQRVFNLWDIIGDHTGAANTAKGNPPCDTTKVISATNPCGYMLVVNAAYKTDTAFKATIANLCPNTYYEISAWIRNICYKCGCDSAGRGASSVGYIPFSTNDSSGVQPNLAFQINGQDYYSTGNIPYTGTGPGITQQASDSVNQWVKRGFVYKTEDTQTGFDLLIRNNAPGGGGNDWVIDDIAVSTCQPIMTYSPSLNPPVCDSNSLVIYDTVRSSYDNYTYYKWQRSTDGGSNWSDVTGPLGPATPTWNGTAWEYVASYTIPPGDATSANNGDMYRMIVATTSTNLGNVNCLFTDVVSIITLDVIECGIPLSITMLTFNAKLENDHSVLNWSTTEEMEPLHFEIERSLDGISFTRIGTVNSHNNFTSSVNYYSFTDPVAVTGKVWYRVIMINNKGNKKFSRIIQLNNGQDQFALVNLVNPFSKELYFDIMTPADGRIDITLLDMNGKIIREQSFSVYAGVNSLTLQNTNNLPSGMYILQLRNKDLLISRRVVKK